MIIRFVNYRDAKSYTDEVFKAFYSDKEDNWNSNEVYVRKMGSVSHLSAALPVEQQVITLSIQHVSEGLRQTVTMWHSNGEFLYAYAQYTETVPNTPENCRVLRFKIRPWENYFELSATLNFW